MKESQSAAPAFPAFHLYVKPGDTVEFAQDDVTFRAGIMKDHESTRLGPDKMSDGFWPSLNPKAAGWIGAGKTRADLAADRERCEALMRAWQAGSLFYCGIVVQAFRGGRVIAEDSLWGIEANSPAMPARPDSDAGARPNAYLDSVAADCLENVRREIAARAAA